MIYSKSTNEKVYIENECQCLARMCKGSIEIFGDIENEFQQRFCYIIPNMKPTLKDWILFKEKVKEYLNFELDDKYIPKSFNLQIE